MNQVVYSVFQGKLFYFINKFYFIFFKNKKRKLSSITQHQVASVEDSRRRSTRSPVYSRYLWIRTALIHRTLHKIVEYIVNNSS